jgi:chromosomal replication initiator protein
MQAWESFLGILQQHFGDETFSKWIRPLKLVHFDACNLYLEAQNSFQIEWFEEHVRAKAKQLLHNNNSHPIKIHITCGEIEPRVRKEVKKEVTPEKPSFVLIRDSLLEEMSQETFIFSPSNRILSSLLESFIDKAESLDFNPLYFHGEACCGKTHFLQAFAHCFRKKGYKTLYVRAETFTENVVHAIRTGNMLDFRNEHRHVDVLIVDNIQYLAKKAATQEEFFHTFNTLHSQGKQIILSADTPPSLLQDIEPRLVSRFEWGLVLPIHKLEKEYLLEMLKSRSKSLSFPVSDAVLKFLVETFSSSIKALQKSLDALVLRSSNTLSKMNSVQLAKDILSDLIRLEQKVVLNPERIVVCVANFFSLNAKDILSKSQTQECTAPRQIAMFLCRKELKMPFARIGEFFKRDHSTVMSSVKSVEERVKKQDKETLAILTSIKKTMLQVA